MLIAPNQTTIFASTIFAVKRAYPFRIVSALMLRLFAETAFLENLGVVTHLRESGEQK
jgi:hypothetical protein